MLYKKITLLAFALSLVLCFTGAVNANADDLGLKIGGKEIGMDIYGKFHVSTDLLEDGKDDSLYVSSNSSRLGFKGGADLDGVEVIWQIESQINFDESGSAFATRNSYVGLSNEAAGTIIWGRHDTPFKTVGRKVDLFGDQIGDSRNIAGLGGIGFNLRADNLVAYISPDMSGLTGTAAYITEDGVDKGDIVSVSLVYSADGLYLGGSFEQHGEALNGATEEEMGFRVGLKYTIEQFAITGLYETLTDVAGINGVDRDTFGAGLAFTPADCDATLKGQYYWTDGVDRMDEAASYLMALGVDYALADSTTLYLAFSYVDNEDNAAVGLSGGGHGDSVIPITGESPYGVSVGMIYKF